MEKKKVYTIGYTLFQRGQMIDTHKMFEVLKRYGVTHLVDVRSKPYSGRFPQCNAESLNVTSKQYGISYIHLPELGAKASPEQDVFSKASEIFFEDIFPITKSNRPENIELFSHEEIVNFKKFRKDEYFSDGIKRIERALDSNFTPVLMCSEKRPIDCHRFFFVSKKIEERLGEWVEVQHITERSDGKINITSNEILEKELIETVFNKAEIKKLDILNSSFFESAKIENYFGETLEEKKIDFCDRYWNLMHGWKMDKKNYYNQKNNDENF